MIIDNGRRARLIIAGVFDGMAGVSRGLVAFIPNRAGNKPEMARGAILDGDPVRLSDVQKAEGGPAYTARYQVIE